MKKLIEARIRELEASKEAYRNLQSVYCDNSCAIDFSDDSIKNINIVLTELKELLYQGEK